MRLVASAASAELPLQEIRVAPAVLAALGAECFAHTLVLGGRILCWAAPEAALPARAVVVPEWMLQALGAAPGSELVLELVQPPADPLVQLRLRLEHPWGLQAEDGAAAPSAAQAEAAPPAAAGSAVGSAGAGGRSDAACLGSPKGLNGGVSSHARASAADAPIGLAPLPPAPTARAIQRQLTGVPLFIGCTVAVRHVRGVVVLAVEEARSAAGGVSAGLVSPSTHIVLCAPRSCNGDRAGDGVGGTAGGGVGGGACCGCGKGSARAAAGDGAVTVTPIAWWQDAGGVRETGFLEGDFGTRAVARIWSHVEPLLPPPPRTPRTTTPAPPMHAPTPTPDAPARPPDPPTQSPPAPTPAAPLASGHTAPVLPVDSSPWVGSGLVGGQQAGVRRAGEEGGGDVSMGNVDVGIWGGSLQHIAVAGHVLLTGPPGVGKASLLLSICRRARARGAVILHLSCLNLIAEPRALETALDQTFAPVLPPKPGRSRPPPVSSHGRVPAAVASPGAAEGDGALLRGVGAAGAGHVDSPPGCGAENSASEPVGSHGVRPFTPSRLQPATPGPQSEPAWTPPAPPPLYLLHLTHLEALCLADRSVQSSPAEETLHHAARRLVQRLRDTEGRTLLCIASVRDARRLPPVLLSHGAFLFSVFLGPDRKSVV